MATVVKLADVLEAMEIPDEWESLLDPITGEITVITDEDRILLEADDRDLDDLPEWQRESVGKARAVLELGRAIPLPDSFDIHEWDLMRRFALSLEDPEQSRELLDAIHGKGAFRLFKMMTGRLGLREQWFEYRDAAIQQIAKDWLNLHDIPFVE